MATLVSSIWMQSPAYMRPVTTQISPHDRLHSSAVSQAQAITQPEACSILAVQRATMHWTAALWLMPWASQNSAGSCLDRPGAMY